MPFDQIVQTTVQNTRDSLWPWFAPEILLAVTMMVLLLLRLLPGLGRIHASWFAVAGCLAALYYTVSPTLQAPGELFTGMLVMDNLSLFIRAILLVFSVLFILLTQLSGMPEKWNAADFYCLILGSLVGMCLMASANHLLMVFLAVEMASVPSYALAAARKGERRPSEAGLKYAVYGAGAAGVMLYGISLLAGLTGSAHLPSVAVRLAESLPTMAGPEKMVLVLSGLMIFVGLAFKLSAFPFHFWCPDVFEGATAEVDAFLSVASKAAALALLVRLTVGLGLPGDRSPQPPLPKQTLAMQVPDGADTPTIREIAFRTTEGSTGALHHLTSMESAVPLSTSADTAAGFSMLRNFLAWFIAVISVVTCTFGNLAAYGQTNIKRLLAYSTIAHAGYMMLVVPAALSLCESHPDAAARAVAALGIYMGIYLFMNLGAFAVVAFLRNALGTEEIADYAGLIRQMPVVVICMGCILFSLVGIPPLAGFVGKFAIFASLAEAYQATGLNYLLILLILGGINTAISLFYYLRVIKVMAIDPEPDQPRPEDWSSISLSGAYLVLVTLPLMLLFLKWNELSDWSQVAAQQLFS